MFNFAFKILRPAIVSVLTTGSALAFSLLGPFANYQTPDLGYNPGVAVNNPESDLGGPMNLNEEYRWNAPVIVYGFDNSFIEYFGEKGMQAVEQAISIINALPPVSEMSNSLNEYPLETLRFNYTAQNLAIVDIKSLTLSLLLEQLGLASPERYAKTIRDRKPITGTPDFQYATITRNFSPVPVTAGDIRSYSYSPYVNGTLYTYVIRHQAPPPAEYWDAQDIAVDVANPRLSVASFMGTQAALIDPRIANAYYFGAFNVGVGTFFTGLTRDDVGGIRYLYHPGRTNVEALPVNSIAGGRGGTSGGGGFSGGSPWTITIPFISTNAVTSTNAATGTAGLVDLAWRGGVDKVIFVRIDPDPFIAQFPRPINLDYTERVFDSVRNRLVIQNVRRVFTRPDITFTAEDLGLFNNNSIPYQMDRTIGAFNNRGADQSGVGRPADGPGTIDSGGVGSRITLNKLGPWSYNLRETSEDESVQGFIFGSFDGTTNSPTVYPTGVTAKQLEQFIYGRN
jgi:hypothetical protein